MRLVVDRTFEAPQLGIARNKTPQFQHLQADKTGNAKRQLGDSFDKRQRDRLLRGNSENAAEQNPAALLRSIGARDDKSSSADRVQKAFDDDRFAERNRMPYE